MDQKKTGSFLQSLRKEKGLTQEELAEKFSVSSRTISRWETGRNMPDISAILLDRLKEEMAMEQICSLKGLKYAIK